MRLTVARCAQISCAKCSRTRSGFPGVPRTSLSYDACTGWVRKARRVESTCIQEDAVKELSLEEVLRIAGGVPVSAALDELTYRAPQEPVGEPTDYARLLNLSLSPSEPK